jgi:hypothetical protein
MTTLANNTAKKPNKATNKEAAQAAVKSTQTPDVKFSLNMLTYATVTPVDRSAKPMASVRQNGQVVFNSAANAIIGYSKDGKLNEDREFFQVGNDEAGNLYLVPAKKDTENAFKATKNNDGFQFRQDNALAKIGVEVKDRYVVGDEQKDGDTVYYVLTKLTKAEAEAEEKAEAGK